jgi:hypothetical protein
MKDLARATASLARTEPIEFVPWMMLHLMETRMQNLLLLVDGNMGKSVEES